jgi:hypothetical protein
MVLSLLTARDLNKYKLESHHDGQLPASAISMLCVHAIRALCNSYGTADNRNA